MEMVESKIKTVYYKANKYTKDRWNNRINQSDECRNKQYPNNDPNKRSDKNPLLTIHIRFRYIDTVIRHTF